MKKILITLCMAAATIANTNAQTNTFPATGNAGIGTLTPASNLQVIGTSRFGSAANYGGFDASGNLSFTGNAAYRVGGNRYAFQYSGNANYGLYFNSTNVRYEFRNGSAVPVFYIGANDGSGVFSAGLQIGNSASNVAGTLRWTGTNFEGYTGASWITLGGGGGGAETDPEVGANTTGFVPRWNGTALVAGHLQDNGSRIGINKTPDTEHRFSSLRQATSGLTTTIYSAVRGENNATASSTINSVGYLGVNNPSGLYGVLSFPDVSVADIGTMGVKNNSTAIGAALYGWNRGGAGTNYGTMGVVTSASGNSYGLFGKATSASTGGNYGAYGNAEGGVVNYGVYGKTTTTAGQFGYAVFGSASGTGTNYAGFFSGDVYIGGDNEAVTVSGTNPYIQLKNGGDLTGYIRASGLNFQVATNAENNSGKLEFRTNGSSRMWIDAAGNVSVGGSGKVATGYLLSVVGKVMAEEVRVELNGTWPDYVFADDYNLMPLQALKQYVMQHNHLPEVPSAEAMKDGIDVGKMNKLLMQKVEELTLYVIQLNEEIQQLKKQNK